MEVLVEVPASRSQEFGMKLDGLPIVISAAYAFLRELAILVNALREVTRSLKKRRQDVGFGLGAVG